MRWEQCYEDATVMLTVKQDGQTQTFPACPTCWKESLTNDSIEVLEAKPI